MNVRDRANTLRGFHLAVLTYSFPWVVVEAAARLLCPRGTTCHWKRLNGGTIALSDDRGRNTKKCERLEPRTAGLFQCVHRGALIVRRCCVGHTKKLALGVVMRRAVE